MTGAVRGGALLVVGDVITDVVARYRGPLAPGTDTTAAIRTVPGGAGANVACWAARRGGVEVRLLGRVGADAAAWHERELAACGVRSLLVVDGRTPTGTVICLVDEGAAAERTFLTDSGASLRLGPGDWSDTLLDGVARLHLSGYLLFTEPSRDEACLLTGASDAADAAARLSRHVPLVVAKQGARGALLARSGAVYARVPAVPATAHDTTGAGDAFTGAFLAALIAGAGPERAAAEGCGAGAQAVERTGGRPPALT